MFARIALHLTLLVFSMTATVGSSYGQALTQGNARELGNALQSANKAMLQSHGHLLDLAKNSPSSDYEMAMNTIGVISAFENTTSGIADLIMIYDAMIDPRDSMFVASVLKKNCQTAPREADLSIKAINLYLANSRAPAVVSEAMQHEIQLQELARCSLAVA
jgi:hypothetical protein